MAQNQGGLISLTNSFPQPPSIINIPPVATNGITMEVGSSDNVVSVDHEMNKDETEVVEPKVGMQFDTDEQVYEFFKIYARQVGFPVKKRSRKKDTDGIVRYATYTCGREGNRDTRASKFLNPRPSTQTGCKVKISARLEPHQKWEITKAVLDHNHQISPTKSRFFKCNKEISPATRKKLTLSDRIGNKAKKRKSPIVKAVGPDSLSFVEKDSRNYVEKVKLLRLGDEEALAIQNYFLKMQEQNMGFFFSMDTDEEGRLKNVFWADGRSRKAYKEFGEVITFDTTYLTNNCEVPIVLFLGANHHGQYTLLGCGLVTTEDTKTFIWLFKTWLICMGNCAPHGIISDQNKEIQCAVATVLPNTRHRWCLLDVMKKFPETLSGHYESVSLALQDLVYDAPSPVVFEQSWNEMIHNYGLHLNEMLSELYHERHRWVPCYVRTSFWAGMSAIQRNETKIPFFDGYINTKTSSKKMIEQYEKALRNKVDKEAMLDFRTFSLMVPCVTTFDMEKQVQNVYTITKFKEFQNELTGQLYCRQICTREGYMVSEHDVREDTMVGDVKKRVIYTVTFKGGQDSEIRCSCHTFEFKGILCRHAIYVLIQNDVLLLPDKYILRRWRKDVERAYTRVKINYDSMGETPEQFRYDKLIQAVTEVAELAAEDEERYREIMEWVDNQKKKTPKGKSSGGSGSNNAAPMA